MPKKQPASWEGLPKFRWVKMINGDRHRITCKNLGLPEIDWTKEKSWDKAKAYFQKIENELAVIVLEPDAQSSIDVLERRLQFAKVNRPDETKGIQTAIDKIKKEHWSTDGFEIDPSLQDALNTFQLLGGVIPEGLSEQQLSQIFGQGKVWQDRLQNQKQVEFNFSLVYQIKEWLELEQGRGIAHKTYLEYVTRSKDILLTLGEQFDCRSINPSTVTSMYKFYVNAAIQKKRNGFRIFKRFIGILVEHDICTLPKNINSKLFQFPTIQPQAIKSYDDQVVIDILTGLPDRARLYALLALNCTMTNKDIANLSKNSTYIESNREYSCLAWVDMAKGTITRSRIKTKHKNPPVVTYKLWESTLTLLKKFWSKDERWVLTSIVNTKLVGDVKTTDLVTKQWGKTKCKINLITFRSISATACGSNLSFANFETIWLGNKPDKIKDKHYVAVSQAIIDDISDYIGDKFKQR